MTAANQKVTSVVVHRKFDRNKLKPKRWSHQDELTALKGKHVRLMFVNGSILERALLLDADQYTICIVLPGQQSTMTYFKSALEGYGAVA